GEQLDPGMDRAVDVRGQAGARRLRIVDGEDLVVDARVVRGDVPLPERLRGASAGAAAQAGLDHATVHRVERGAVAADVVLQLERGGRLVQPAEAGVGLGAVAERADHAQPRV